MMPPALSSKLFPYTTLFRSEDRIVGGLIVIGPEAGDADPDQVGLDGSERGVVDAELGVAPRALVRGEDVHAQRLDELRSEEHTSELQSHSEVVCRLLVEKKK